MVSTVGVFGLQTHSVMSSDKYFLEYDFGVMANNYATPTTQSKQGDPSASAYPVSQMRPCDGVCRSCGHRDDMARGGGHHIYR